MVPNSLSVTEVLPSDPVGDDEPSGNGYEDRNGIENVTPFADKLFVGIRQKKSA